MQILSNESNNTNKVGQCNMWHIYDCTKIFENRGENIFEARYHTSVVSLRGKTSLLFCHSIRNNASEDCHLFLSNS